MCEGPNVPLDLRGAKRVRGEMCEHPADAAFCKKKSTKTVCLEQ